MCECVRVFPMPWFIHLEMRILITFLVTQQPNERKKLKYITQFTHTSISNRIYAIIHIHSNQGRKPKMRRKN